MTRRQQPGPRIARENRRGCFAIALLLALLVAALAYVGFSAPPIDDLNADIPTIGG